MKNQIKWPNNSKFAFSIFDDTDNSTIFNTRPVYDFLKKRGIITTKSIWVYPPRGSYIGESLHDIDYVNWIRSLQNDGFEIGIHNVGDGEFTRKEIIEGFEVFKELLGSYPSIHTNHATNIDNLYSWEKRFEFPISTLYKLYRYFYFIKRKKNIQKSYGEIFDSKYFWGDIAKNNIKYIRNLTFSNINTLKLDPLMPWHDKKKSFANQWFSSSDGSNLGAFNNLLSTSSLDNLVQENGACIVYTHFASGFVNPDGELDKEFQDRIIDLSSRGGWFVPVSTLLNYLAANNESTPPSYFYKLKLSYLWFLERLSRKINQNI
jgi:hypothetical protein